MPRTEGVCTDVVIRALRNAGIDLQEAVYRDAGVAPAAYPRIGRRRNPSIDHRRVKNLVHYFARHWRRVPAGAPLAPGDVLFLDAVAGVADPDHVGIASDGRNARGLPLVIHNWHRAAEMDLLPQVPLLAAFRVPPRGGPGLRFGQVPTLLALFGSKQGLRLPLEAACLIGRSSSADIQLLDAGASREHCRFTVEDGRVWVEDLGSQNGTFINGEPLAARMALAAGDEIAVGDSLFVLDGDWEVLAARFGDATSAWPPPPPTRRRGPTTGRGPRPAADATRGG